MSPSIIIIAYEINGKEVMKNKIILPGVDEMYKLYGIIYHCNPHFMCGLVDKSNSVYYHDGIKNVMHYTMIIL